MVVTWWIVAFLHSETLNARDEISWGHHTMNRYIYSAGVLFFFQPPHALYQIFFPYSNILLYCGTALLHSCDCSLSVHDCNSVLMAIMVPFTPYIIPLSLGRNESKPW